jgi:hypothetical protein
VETLSKLFEDGGFLPRRGIVTVGHSEWLFSLLCRNKNQLWEAWVWLAFGVVNVGGKVTDRSLHLLMRLVLDWPSGFLLWLLIWLAWSRLTNLNHSVHLWKSLSKSLCLACGCLRSSGVSLNVKPWWHWTFLKSSLSLGVFRDFSRRHKEATGTQRTSVSMLETAALSQVYSPGYNW